MRKKGRIPVKMVEGDLLPEVWENSLIETWKYGARLRTKYDREGDPHSKFCTMTMVVNEPLKEPMIHGCFPGGFDDLEIYRLEIMNGARNWWMNEGKEDYTYNDRLFHFSVDNKIIDQINNFVIPVLAGQRAYPGAESDPYIRRAQAITWKPWHDPGKHSTPCLQRVWFQIIDGENDELVLNMETHWRSRDAFKAAFMNMYAFAHFQKWVAEEIFKLRQTLAKVGELSETDDPSRPIVVGSYVDISNNYHLYGSYFKDPDLPMSFQGFLKSVEKRSEKDRYWRSDDPIVQDFFIQGQEKIKQELKNQGLNPNDYGLE